MIHFFAMNVSLEYVTEYSFIFTGHTLRVCYEHMNCFPYKRLLVQAECRICSRSEYTYNNVFETFERLQILL